MTNDFNSLFNAFQPSPSLSLEGMSISREERSSQIVDSLSTRAVSIPNPNHQTVEYASGEIEHLSLSPDQQLVLKSIRNVAPSLWNDVLFQLQQLSIDFDQEVVVDIPKVQLPVCYYQKRGEENQPNHSEEQQTSAEACCCIAEIKIKNDLFFIPAHYTLSEFVSFYTTYTSISDTPSQFLIYIDGKCYTPNGDSAMPQSLLAWLHQQFPAFLDAELSCTDASAASIASLAIRFQHDYLLLLVNAAEPSYSEVRFSFLNLFLYPCRTAAGRSDFSLMSSAALTEAQFPVVISTRMKRTPVCFACAKREAVYCVKNDVLSPCSPCYYCASCLQTLHYDETNHLIGPPFSMVAL
ncbi:hypothetical protein WA556_006520 [Blastocystis sp. ATCC 50177/Nand II]